MTIRTVYHATDGEQFPSRAEAQHYERALEVLRWLEGHPACTLTTPNKKRLAEEFGQVWDARRRRARKAGREPS